MIIKSSLSMLLAASLVFGATAAIASSPDPGASAKGALYVNGTLQTTGGTIHKNETAYVSIRNLFDSIGAKVEWIAGTQSAIIIKENTKVHVQANNPRVKIGDEWIILTQAPFIQQATMYIPTELVTALGFQATYDEAKGQAQVKTADGLSAFMSKAKVGNWGRWGSDDQVGAVNLITPEKVKEAAALIDKGKVYQLGQLIEPKLTGFPGRDFKTSLSHTHDDGVFGENSVTYMDDKIDGTMQWATQLDGFSHIGAGPFYYNGHDAREFVQEWGNAKLGIEQVPSLMTRGVLLDIAGYRGVDMLVEGEEITVADLKGAMEKQNVQIGAGDVVILHTGWSSLWHTDNKRFNTAEPGLGSEAALWLAKQDVAMIGSDTWALEVLPNAGEPYSAFPVHQILLLEHGIYILENIVTEELAKDKVYEFAFSVHPLEIKGATASNIAPVAID
jgi:kynurenine formamidase